MKKRTTDRNKTQIFMSKNELCINLNVLGLYITQKENYWHIQDLQGGSMRVPRVVDEPAWLEDLIAKNNRGPGRQLSANKKTYFPVKILKLFLVHF